MRLMIFSLAVTCLIPSSAEAQRPLSITDGTGAWEVILTSTLRNSYSRGNLDDWWAERSGDPSRKVDQGSPAFFALEGRYMMPNPFGKGWLAPGVGIIFPAERALWGSSIYFGGFQRLVMQPAITSFTASMILPIEQVDGLTAEFGGGLLLAWVSGTYVGTDFDEKIKRKPGIGITLTGGANYTINDKFGVTIKSGLRFVRTGLATADTKFTLENGDAVKASLSGFYLTIGVTFRPLEILAAVK